MRPPAVWYQVRAEKDGRVITFGLSCTEDDEPLAMAMNRLGSSWWGASIKVSWINPNLLVRMVQWGTYDP